MSDTTRKRLLERGPDGKPSHPYTKAGETDLASLFKRIRRQQKEELKQAATNVKPLKRQKS